MDSDEGRMKRQGAERIEVNLDDVNDDDDNEEKARRELQKQQKPKNPVGRPKKYLKYKSLMF